MIISAAKHKTSEITDPKTKISTTISKNTNYIQSWANLLYIFSARGEKLKDRREARQLFIVQSEI